MNSLVNEIVFFLLVNYIILNILDNINRLYLELNYLNSIIRSVYF